MFGTIFALIVAVFFAIGTWASPIPFDLPPIYFVVTIVGSLFLFFAFFATSIIWISLQRSEEESVPRAQELFLKDWYLYFQFFALFLFALFSYLIVLLEASGIDGHVVKVALSFWIFACGVSADLLRAYVRRMFSYTQHIFLLEKVKQECLHAIAHGQESLGFEWLDNELEVVVKLMRKGSFHVAAVALSQVFAIVEGYVGAASLSLRIDPLQSRNISLLDRVNYLSVYVSKRLDWIFEDALTRHMHPLAEEIITIFGKVSLYYANYHPQAAHIPLLSIERCGKIALRMNHDEVNFRCVATYSELIKNFIRLAKEKGATYNDVILLALSHLEELVSAEFQKNREMSVALLMQPFAEVGQMIAEEAYQEFAGREEVLRELKRSLEKYNALDLIMQKKGVTDSSS